MANAVRELYKVLKDTELLPVLPLERFVVALQGDDLRLESPLDARVQVAHLSQRSWAEKPSLRGEFFAFHPEILAA